METSVDRQGEIDLAWLLKSFWLRRRFIAKVAGVVLALGLVAALFGQVEYTSSAVVVPQIGKNPVSGNLQGLAAMAGINMGLDPQGELLSPLVYPMVVGSVPFQKELMHSQVTVAGHQEPVTLLAYFTEPGYRKFSLFPFLTEYTLGLPGLIVGAIRGDRDKPEATLPEGVEELTDEEHECMETLSKLLVVTVDDKNGYISLEASMPDALMSAQVAARAQELLQQYVTRFKLQKVQATLDFVEARYEEVKADYQTKQRALATFQDANRNITSALVRTRESRLSDESNLAFSVYSDMARQREQARIKVKEDTPTFTVVEPVTVPIEKSAPRRALIMVGSLLLGLFVGMGLVFILPWVAETFEVERLNGWRAAETDRG